MPLPAQNVAYLETTILADSLFKTGTTLKAEADQARKLFAQCEMPQYSIKELKSGVLVYYAWLHNCLVTEKTLSATLLRIQRVQARMPKRASTGLETVATHVSLLSKGIQRGRSASLGLAHDPDTWFATEMRIALKTLIFKAWAKRSRLAQTIQKLSCYNDTGPLVGKDGLIEIPDKKCNTADCSMRKMLQSDRAALQALLTASDTQLPSTEAHRRSKVLRELLRGKKAALLSPGDCQSLGDAVFAFFAPTTSAILTTNVRDHALLGGAVGKTAISPKQVLAP